MKHHAILLPGLLVLALLSRSNPERPAPGEATAQDDEPEVSLVESLAASDVRLDVERGMVSIPARVLVRRDLLEYLLVNSRGATHESMFVTEVVPSMLNVGLLATGVDRGANARFEPLEPAPPEEEGRDGRPAVEVVPPSGDGFLLYAAWREGEETYLYRVDDLISNLTTGRSMRRHRWVYLGSRFAVLRGGEEEKFVADLEGNLINISFFYQGNTLLTAALPQCVEQTIWVANSWLLPPFEAPVSLIFSREKIDRLSEDWEASLPVVTATEGAADGG